MIHLKNIKFAYEDNIIFDNLSLNITSGSWLGVIGPNGAGKTTLLNLISGFLNPASGTVFLEDKNIRSFSRREIAGKIAVVPQTTSMAFSFTALEVVLMGRFPHLKHFGFETARDLEIARDVMEKTDTWRFRERPIDRLSGGERQRVFIARALAQKPKVLLLDEPTTFLDIRHQAEIMEILSSLGKRENITIVSAIHDINLAISYCTEIALLNQGKIFKLGAPVDVVTYANLKQTFDAEVYVGVNEFTGKPYYVPMKKS